MVCSAKRPQATALMGLMPGVERCWLQVPPWASPASWEPSLKLSVFKTPWSWGVGFFWKHLAWERVEMAKWHCCCQRESRRLSKALEGSFVAGGNLEPPPLAWGSAVPCSFVPLCLVYELRFGQCPSGSPDHTDMVCANLLGWTRLVWGCWLGGGDGSRRFWSVTALWTGRLMNVNITPAFYLQLMLVLLLELLFSSMRAGLFWIINLTASE